MRKYGFTLVELLAVIVILAAVALIVTPVITGLITKANNSADLRSAELYLEAASNYFGESKIDSDIKSKLGSNVIDELDVSNKKATGSLVVNKDGTIEMAIIINNKCYRKAKSNTNGDISVFDDVNKCQSYLVPPDECFDITEPTIEYSVNVSNADAVNACITYMQKTYTSDDADHLASACNGTASLSFPNSLYYYIKSGAFTENDITYLKSDAAHNYLQPTGKTETTIKKYKCGATMASLDEKNYTVTYNSDADYPSIKIPTEINGSIVKMIETSAFVPVNVETNKSDFTAKVGIENVEIPSNVLILGFQSFGVNNINEVILDEGVKMIGGYAFALNKLTKVVIPSSVKGIGNYAFMYNQLASVTINDKAAPADLFEYGTSIWGWDDGYSDSNIKWNG